MENQEIINALKSQYNRDLRKQIVKNILLHEKNEDTQSIESSYNVINQIFSYVIAQLNWSIADNSTKWDDSPLQVMSHTFPKIESTIWFKNKQLHVRKD